MSAPLNAGQRLSRGVAIIASVEPEACADIHGETLWYGDVESARYNTTIWEELKALGWYPREGSWAFNT